MLLCLTLWTVIFYLPFGYYVTSLSYANGEQAELTASLVLTAMIVLGNQVMSFAADASIWWAGFTNEDQRQFWFNVYYLVACILSIFANLSLSGYLSYREMVSAGVHTADGRLLGSLSKVQDVVESYPMQKTLGRLLFRFAFPGTFLTPFAIESIVCIFIPYCLSKWILQSHREYQERDAETIMQYFIKFDHSRYSDTLLSMIVATLVLFLPGGYVLPMYMAFVLSQIFIYGYDHWRVLRDVPASNYCSPVCDRFGTSWIAVPAALALSCAVFKGYHFFWPDLNGWSLLCVMMWAFVLHIFLHRWILTKVYKIQWKRKVAEIGYEEAAKSQPITYFSTNPVHCLRSKYIWNHEPAQVFHILGKEHLQRENAEIGSYFEDHEAQKPASKAEDEVDKADELDKAAPQAQGEQIQGDQAEAPF
jgi:hypothetical protein